MMHKKNGNDYVIKEEDLGMFWHLYIHKIKDYLCSYKDIIFCGEGFNSTKWRKETYPPYKENRKARADNPDYKFIGKCYKDVEKFIDLLGLIPLKTENCEADDEIYKLSEYFTSKGDDVLIVSSDKDLTQIATFFDGVSVYSPIKKECLPIDENIIIEKSIVGDPSDNILGIPKIGKKTFEKMLQDKILWDKKMTPENVELHEKILSIVDLRKYPKKFQDDILENYKNYDKKELDIEGVEKFYIDNGLNQCLREWSELSSEMLLLNRSDDSSILDAEDELEQLING